MENIQFTVSEVSDEDSSIPVSKSSFIRQQLSQFSLPVYYKYRYTFPPDSSVEYQKATVGHIIHAMKEQGYIIDDKYIASIEHYSVGMTSAKPHCHIHFTSRAKSDTIRKQLARQFEMIGRVQCCKAEINVDEHKFWRYVLKQQKNNSYVYYTYAGFEKEYILTQRDIAYEVWKVAAEVSVAKREKVEETNSLKDRLFIYLSSCGPITRREVIAAALMYYVEKEQHPVNNQTIDGYVNLYMLQKRLISYDTYINQNFKNI